MTSQAAIPDCSAFNSPVYYRTNPQTRSAFLTSSLSESNTSVTHGFTTDHKTLFEAAAAPGTALKSVHRMRRTTNGDYLFTANSGEISSASKQGYVDEGSSFYASPSSAACLVPVYRYLLKSKHQYAVSSADRSALVAAAWKNEGVAFYVGAKAGAPPTSRPPPLLLRRARPASPSR